MGRLRDLNKQFALRLVDYVIIVCVIVLVAFRVHSRDKAPTERLIRVGIVSWPGYAGGLVANKGKDASTDSCFYQTYGLLVKFQVEDDADKLREAFARGDVDIMWSTVDALAAQIPAYFSKRHIKPVALMQVDWSRGGDAIVAKSEIERIEDLRGHTIAVPSMAPSQWLLEYSLEKSLLSEKDRSEIRARVRATSGSDKALQLFLDDSTVAAAVLWEPDVTEATQGLRHRYGNHVLISTAVADNLIADVMIAKKEFVEGDRRKDVADFIKGWLLDGAPTANKDKMLAVWALEHEAKFSGLGDEKTRDLIDTTVLATLEDNVEMFGLAGGAPRFDYIFDQASKVWLKRGQITASAKAADAYDTSFLKEMYPMPAKRVCDPEILTTPVALTFDSRRTGLCSEARQTLDELSRSLKTYSQAARFLVQAEAGDANPFQSASFALGREREHAVIDYLVMQGDRPRSHFLSSVAGAVRTDGSGKPIQCIRLQLAISEGCRQ